MLAVNERDKDAASGKVLGSPALATGGYLLRLSNEKYRIKHLLDSNKAVVVDTKILITICDIY